MQQLAVALLLGHVVPFDWLGPARSGNASSDAGTVTLSWVDGADPPGTAVVALYVVRGAISPFAFPKDAGVLLGTVPVPDPANVLDVDVSALEPGCWTPFAVVSDPVDTGTHAGAGNFTIGPGPSIWVTNLLNDGIDDAGFFTLRWETHGTGTVTVRAHWSDGGTTLSSNLPATATAQLVIDTQRLPGGMASFLQVELSSDAGTCDAYFDGYLFVPERAAKDAGTEPPPPPKGCGCASDSTPLFLGLCFWVICLRHAKPRSAVTVGPLRVRHRL